LAAGRPFLAGAGNSGLGRRAQPFLSLPALHIDPLVISVDVGAFRLAMRGLIALAHGGGS